MVRRSTAGAILAALLLTSCTSDQAEPPDNPSEEPTTSPTEAQTQPAAETEDEPTAEPEPYPLPERPEAMDHDNLDGAEAAAIYFLELFLYAYATGDLEPWNEMSSPSCDFCGLVRDGVEELYETNGYATTTPQEVEETSAQIYTSSDGDYLVEVIHYAPPIAEYDSQDNLVYESERTRYRSLIVLSHAAPMWSVSGLQGEEHP